VFCTDQNSDSANDGNSEAEKAAMAEKEQELNTLKDRLAQLEDLVRNAEAERDELQLRCADQENGLMDLTMKLDENEAQMDALRTA